MIAGSIVALVSLFTGPNGGIDDAAYADLVTWQIAGGTNGLLVGSVLGEGPSLSSAETLRLLRIAVECAAGRVPVIAATGSYSTAASIALTLEAKAAGADAALIVTPYYNRPSQDGLFRHFEAIAQAADLPILLENAPGRTAVTLALETIGRLARVDHIIGLLEAAGDPARLAMVAQIAGPHFIQLSGDDSTAAMVRLAGGFGCVSAAANIAPRLCADLQRACSACDFVNAAALQRALQPLAAALSREADPAVVKHALSLLRPGCRPEVRLPMIEASPQAAAGVEACVRPRQGASPSGAPDPRLITPVHGNSRDRPPEPRPRSGSQPVWALVGVILLREGTMGTLLFAAMGDDRTFNGIICLAGLLVTMVVTHRYGLLRHRGWRDVASEGLIVFCGALACRNILIVLARL